MHLWIKKFQLVVFILFYDVLSYHPSLGLINQVRFNFFSLPTKEAKFFYVSGKKSNISSLSFLFVNRSTLFMIPTIFVGALRSITSGEKQVKKFAKTSNQLVHAKILAGIVNKVYSHKILLLECGFWRQLLAAVALSNNTMSISITFGVHVSARVNQILTFTFTYNKWFLLMSTVLALATFVSFFSFRWNYLVTWQCLML